MLNYIHAEFYKVFRRKYTWITLAVALALETLLVGGYVFTNVNGNDIDFYSGAVETVLMLSIGFAATLLTGDMVFAGQYKHATLKNEVSFGLSRSRIYLGKLIVQTLLSVLYCVVMVAFYVGLCWLTLYHEPARDALALRIIGYCLATAFPLWLGVQALTCAAMFLIRSEVGAVFVSLGIFMVLPSVIEIAALLIGADRPAGAALMTLYQHMPTVMADAAKELVGDWACCGKAWLVGAVWCAGFTAIGLFGFHKKEIK